MALVTLAVAKDHLRLDWAATSPPDPREADLLLKMEQASDIIVGYLKVPVTSPPMWDDTTVPARIQAAVLLMLAQLYENRGDDESFGVSSKSAATWDAIERLLARDRDPALA